MPITAQIPVRDLHLIAPFRSTDETRFVITGVLLELRPGSPPTLVATDGRCLATVRCTEDIHDATTNELIVLPDAFIRLMAVFFARMEEDDDGREITAVLSYEPDTGQISAQVLDIKLEFKEVEGNYPNWRLVIPEVPEPCVCNFDRTVFDPILLHKCITYIQEKRGRTVVDAFGANNQPLVFKTHNAMTVLMSMRAEGSGPATLAPFLP